MLDNGNQEEDQCQNGVSIDCGGVDGRCCRDIVLPVRHLHILSVDLQPSEDEEATTKEAFCDLL